MTAETRQQWRDANYQYLQAEVAKVRQLLEQHAQKDGGTHVVTVSDKSQAPATQDAAKSEQLALESLCKGFNLNAFERNVILLCVGVELDGRIASLCAKAQPDPQRDYATFSLALALWPQSSWSALMPTAPLRYWRMIEMEPSRTLVYSPIRIDERVFGYLLGWNHLDERLTKLLQPLDPSKSLAPTHEALVDTISDGWKPGPDKRHPILYLCGPEAEDKRAIAAAICQRRKLNLYRMPLEALTNNVAEPQELLRLWEREAALSSAALLLDADAQSGESGIEGKIARFLTGSYEDFIVTSRERHIIDQHEVIAFDVAKPTTLEQKVIWENELVDFAAIDGFSSQLDRIVDQFSFSTAAIMAVTTTAKAQMPAIKSSGAKAETVGNLIWDLCRLQARPALDDLAQYIEPMASEGDLVLPEAQYAILKEIKVQVLQRRRVYETWNFESKSKRGLGISALFAGSSGTGKTMAAEVLAQWLRLDLYRIDLSAVVSKYIGETEKNLRRIFDSAESGGVILLFDEADALFGKRSQVKDSHDRYANIEVSYLLQRMEAYRGLAILTTNMKDALDSAFLRRLRFVVQFPFPDAEQRIKIWQNIFPAGMEKDQLDFQKLARLNIAGGNIRNIALNAAFMAAGSGKALNMDHLLSSTKREYAKLERTLTDSETRDWPISNQEEASSSSQ